MKKGNKTIFSKIFVNNILSVLIAVAVLLTIEFTMITSLISRVSERNLKENAMDIERMIEGGGSSEYLNTFIRGFSISANRNIIIIDSDCNILMHSVVTGPFDETRKKIPYQYCEEVLKNRESVVKGTMGGTFDTNMFTLQIPVVNKLDNNRVLGAIMISMPFPETKAMEVQILKIMLLSLLVVLVIIFILSFILSKRISKPIKQIGNSVNKFAKSDFEERIDLNKNIYNIKEFRELANNFNNMADELEKADNIKDNFISDVSHELRTPMTTISGFVDGILDDAIPEEKQKDYLKIVKDEMARLTKLVNDFLDVTRLKGKDTPLKMKDFDIAEMIRVSVIGISSKIEEKDIDIVLNFEQDNMAVFADFDAIKRVITNLLDNAVKFTDQGGKISVSLEKKKHETIISVYNTGVGISEKDIPYIFDRFYKADKSRSINKSGTGVGLFLVKDILTRHEKEIIIQSREGEFAKFTFFLDNAKQIKN